MAEQRKIVFFLGAGASLGAGAKAKVQGAGSLPIPTQSDFWETFVRFTKSQKNKKIIESFLFKYFLGYSKVPSKLSAEARRNKLKGIDVEEVFTFLSERARAPSTSVSMKTHCGKVWSALVEELPKVFRRFPANKNTRRVYKLLLQDHFKSFDTFVSFNYDTVFEGSLPRDSGYSYSGVSVSNGGIRVFKPHGSVNWEDCEPVRVKANPSKALVVAPTHLKFVQIGRSSAEEGDSLEDDGDARENDSGYLDHSEALSEIWRQMESEMRSAKALVFIGYSFPVADLYFSSVLRSVLADRGRPPGLVIVNPDARAIRDRLRSRFPIDRVALYYDLATFAQAKRADILGSVC